MIPLLLAALAALAPAPSPSSDAAILGTWANPKGTIIVRTARCASGICGRVVWASPEAQEDARVAGVSSLVGTELLRGFRPVGAGRWQGEAFVPDLGGTFQSEMSLLGRNRLQIEGCRFGRLLCRQQVWQRRAAPPARRR
jgi:uncharacterized protein (DUF2147 family)